MVGSRAVPDEDTTPVQRVAQEMAKESVRSAVVGGIALMVCNATTKVKQDLGASPPSRLPPGPGTSAPTWNTAATEPKNLPPALGIPIFSGRF